MADTPDMNELKAELAHKQKELDLLKALDEIRDAAPDIQDMLAAVADLLSGTLAADFCTIFLLDDASRALVPQTIRDPQGIFEQMGASAVENLAGQIAVLNGAATWSARDRLPSDVPVVLPEHLYLAASPIVMGETEHLGALLLGKTAQPFTPTDLELLSTAEDQVDSAIIQARLQEQHHKALHALRQQQQKLELLTLVDEIRDTNDELTSILAAIVDLLASRLKGDLCAIFLLDRETREPELKAISQRSRHFSEIQRFLTQDMVKKAIALEEIATWEFAEDAPAGEDDRDLLYLIAVPILLQKNPLGAIMLVREKSPFVPEELELLQAAEDQLDSTIIHCYIQERQREFAAEVDTIYEIDQIRDQDLPFDEMLNKVIQALIAKINAETAFIMLYDRTGTQLEMRATTHLDFFQTWQHYPKLESIVEDALRQGKLVTRNDLDEGFRSIMCLPLIFYNKVIGVIGVMNRYGPRGFTGADQRLLSAIGSQIDTAIYERREIRRLRQVLGRSIGPRVMDRVLATPDIDILKPERQEMTVLFADLRGSTLLAEQIHPELFVDFIKDYLTQMTDVVLSLEGTVDKFVGDEVMALFGAPIPQEDHALRAIRVGLAMQRAHTKGMQTWVKHGVPHTPMGIGIVTGKMIVGEMGGSQRSNYTVMGREVNLGSRICGVAKAGQVLVSQATYDLVMGKVRVTPLPGQRFKGVERDVTIYHVTDVVGG